MAKREDGPPSALCVMEDQEAGCGLLVQLNNARRPVARDQLHLSVRHTSQDLRGPSRPMDQLRLLAPLEGVWAMFLRRRRNASVAVNTDRHGGVSSS